MKLFLLTKLNRDEIKRTIFEINFEELYLLDEIYLPYLELQDIKCQNGFSKLKNLKNLLLHKNSFKNISSNFFNGLTNLKELSLANNPLDFVEKVKILI